MNETFRFAQGDRVLKAVIFDMDGVLVDSQPLHFDTDVAVLKELGVADADVSTVTPYAGMSNADRWAKYKRDFDLAPEVADIIAVHARIIAEMLQTQEIRAIDGVEELLKRLTERGVSCSVASSSSYDFVFSMLDKINLRKYFSIVVSGEDLTNSKPAPDIFLKTLSMHSVNKDEAVIIEDSANGVRAAVAAGIRCIGYRNASSGEQDLSGADIIISEFKGLVI
jgi:HAD superfamily hydrolase (TIGR01509 family)